MIKRMRLINMLETTPMLMHPLWYQSIVNLVQDKDMLDGIDDKAFISQINDRADLLSFVNGEKPENTKVSEIRGNVGIIKITSPFIRYGGLMELSGYSSTETLAKEYSLLENNPSINTIVTVFDTGGGDARGVSELADFIKNSNKKTVAYIDANAHSAGYWVASAHDEIVSNKTASVGSIGAVYSIRGGKKDENTIKIVSTNSPKKQPDASTKKGKAQIQVWADDLANVFIQSVADNRNVSFDDVIKKFGAGDSFIASKALEAGMIDSIGNFEELITKLQKGDTQMSVQKTQTSATAQTDEEVAPAIETVDTDAVVAQALADERERASLCLQAIPTAYADNKELIAMVNDGKSTAIDIKAKLWDLKQDVETPIVKAIEDGKADVTTKADDVDTSSQTELSDDEKEAQLAMSLAKQSLGE